MMKVAKHMSPAYFKKLFIALNITITKDAGPLTVYGAKRDAACFSLLVKRLFLSLWYASMSLACSNWSNRCVPQATTNDQSI